MSGWQVKVPRYFWQTMAELISSANATASSAWWACSSRAVGVPVRKALFELGRVILAQQTNPPNAEDPYRRSRTLSVQL